MSTAQNVEVTHASEPVVQTNVSNSPERIEAEVGETPTVSNAEYYSLEELDQLENESMAAVVRKIGNMRFRRNPSYKYKPSASKRWNDTDNKPGNNKVGNSTTKVNESTFQPEVTFTDKELVYQLSHSLECAQRTIKKAAHENAVLLKEINEIKKVHINQDELAAKVVFLENRVRCYQEVEIFVRNQLKESEAKCDAFRGSAKIVRNSFNQEIVDGTIGIGYDYNKAAGKRSINSPNIPYPKEKGIPQILKSAKEPMYKECIPDPFDESIMMIKHELLVEDLTAEREKNDVCDIKEKNVKKQELPPKDIRVKNVQKDKWVPIHL